MTCKRGQINFACKSTFKHVGLFNSYVNVLQILKELNINDIKVIMSISTVQPCHVLFKIIDMEQKVSELPALIQHHQTSFHYFYELLLQLAEI